jgi:cyanate permease
VIQILLIAAFVSLFFGILTDPAEGWLEGTAIFVAVVIVVSVSAVQDWLKQKQF